MELDQIELIYDRNAVVMCEQKYDDSHTNRVANGFIFNDINKEQNIYLIYKLGVDQTA